ncbi:hypothetical protein JXJ21_00830 [candidate division KSB1 bacterium]|nr:hypothetical protein [candidate division KSB1 bacterium]
MGFFRAQIQQQTQKKVTADIFKVSGLSARKDLEQSETPSGMNFLAVGTFVFLTLMFPLVGGICFSAGWRRLENVKQYRNAKKTHKRIKKDYESKYLKLQQEQTELASLDLKLKRERDDYAHENSLADYWVNLYRHGYLRGKNVPETLEAGETLYERCEKSVAKLFSRKLRDKLFHEC